MRKLSIVISVIFIMTASMGCSFYKWLSKERVNLVGKWQFKDPAMGPAILALKEDGTYELDDNGDGTKDIWGHYRPSLNWVTFKDEGGNFDKTCGQDGSYEYKIKGRTVTFNIMADPCARRSSALSVAWKRVPHFVYKAPPAKPTPPPPKVNWTW